MRRVKKVTTSERSEASETSIENKTKPDKENKIIMSSVEVNIVRLQGLIDGETNQTVMLAYLAQQTEWVKQRVGNSFPNSFALPFHTLSLMWLRLTYHLILKTNLSIIVFSLYVSPPLFWKIR